MRSLFARLRSWPNPIILRRYHRPDGKCVTTIELRQWLPVAALGGLIVWYVVAPTEVVTMALAAVGSLLLGAFWWARTMALGVTARRQLHYAAVQVGDEVEELITLDNATSLPMLWAEFVDASNLPGYAVASVRAADARQRVDWRVHAICAHRGLFVLGPWELRLGDPFGFFRVTQVYTHPQELMVYPPLANLPTRLLPQAAARGDQRRLRQPLHAETLTAISTRAYIPGDTLRHLHWPTTARKGEPYTKVFEPEATSTFWLIPDFDQAAHVRQGDDSTEETLVLLTASLAAHLLRERLSVGLIAYTTRPTLLTPRRGQGSLWQFLRALAPLHADCPWPLAQTLDRAQSLISARDVVLVLTPAVTVEWSSALRRIMGRGGGANVILLDPASFGGVARAEVGVSVLNNSGLTAQVVRQGELEPTAETYGALRRWEFMTLGTGRVVTRQTPREAVNMP